MILTLKKVFTTIDQTLNSTKFNYLKIYLRVLESYQKYITTLKVLEKL